VSLFRRLFGSSRQRVVLNRVDVHVATEGGVGDPHARELEVELRRALDGVTDPAEMQVVIERFGREHALPEGAKLSVQETRLPPEGTAASEDVAELQRALEGVTDPAEMRALAERLAREHGWTVRTETSDGEPADGR
jgi:hypothetical protein